MDSKDREHFDELILKAVQSGKKETSGIILEFKEHVNELGQKTDRIETKLVEIVEQFKTLNGKVARHETDITEIKMKNIQESSLVSILAKEKEERDQDFKVSNKKWRERAVWAVIVISVLLLSKVGLVSNELFNLIK